MNFFLKPIMSLVFRLPFCRHLPDKVIVCLKCGSENNTLKMTEWITGYKIKNEGRTNFNRICLDCDYEWKMKA